ncbi:ankyrin repeat domain-containing protein 53 [Oncorhynchus tshawytscha]|uniref:ankyrin repeat domain-containing protein 53 n=1 Tax=Oncorhynchus tshawytscha TaxID=74940 RepID=UPI000D0A154F|nr:ankyrin repeat domain-containing protein 53 [Oncorhynchus tshawytscha]
MGYNSKVFLYYWTGTLTMRMFSINSLLQGQLLNSGKINKPRVGGGVVLVRRLVKAPPDSDMFQAATSGDRDWLRLSLKRALSPTQLDKQGLTVLHVAGLHGQLECMKLLLASQVVDINASCPLGRRAIHMVLTAKSRPHSHACLTYLLEHGALPNVATDTGLTPLHLAATEGLWECTKTLVQAGADTGARDNRGHTPLELARIWCHRRIARFLKDSMWQNEKKREMERRKALQNLRQDLFNMHRRVENIEKVGRQKLMEEKVTAWADKKGLPLLWAQPMATWNQAHAHCLSPDQRPQSQRTKVCHRQHPGAPPREAWNISPNPSKPPPASVSRPQGVRLSSQPERSPPEPDLRRSITLCRARGDGRPHYTAKWDGSPQSVPNLPWDVLQRGLFSAAFPSRIASPNHFQPNHVLDLPRLGCSPGPNTSPWTEVAMHLAEELEPGHY